MPHFFENNTLVVTKDEIMPWFNNNDDTLYKSVQRYKDKTYGIKRVMIGGGGHPMLISYDSLPSEIKTAIPDPRKHDHLLERYYKVDGEAVRFFAEYRFEDGTALKAEYQEKYIINASVLGAVLALKAEREAMWRSLGRGSTKGITRSLCQDVFGKPETKPEERKTFNQTLLSKHKVEHTLPENLRRFQDALQAFEKDGYASLISKKHKNDNSRKVTDTTLMLLNSMFAGDETKPTATAIWHRYNQFINNTLDVINADTGEKYNPKEFKSLSPVTVTNYMAMWANRIGTHRARSGDNQKYMANYKPYFSFKRPEFAGSRYSIDDRQPPFKMHDGNRVWFYNGLDVASDAITCWVYGKTKEGIILDFYRQLIRNYAEWGLCLPAELEAEMSLNASFKNTFLREGAMFDLVQLLPNNARAKIIESRNKELRYDLEKDEHGWLARPFALSEANQAGPDKTPMLDYDVIVNKGLSAIQAFNNRPHAIHTHKSRWDVFLETQNPNLKPINYTAILPHLGWKTETSVRLGIIKLNYGEYLLGDNGKIATGERLINLMKQVEGEDITIWWLDGNDGKVLKALIYIGSQYICEAVAKPLTNRATIERTPADHASYALMGAYVKTIEGFGNRQQASFDKIITLDNEAVVEGRFKIKALDVDKRGGFHAAPHEVEILPEVEAEEDLIPVETRYKRDLKDRF